jgi:hypothetical protein
MQQRGLGGRTELMGFASAQLILRAQLKVEPEVVVVLTDYRAN